MPARRPALNVLTPAVPPLSVMKMTMVSSSRPSSARNVPQVAEAPVEVGDHAEETGRPLALVGLDVFLQVDAGGVRGVRRQVAEERLVPPPAFLHPGHRGVEPEVGAVAPVTLLDAVVEVTAVDERPVELGGGLKLAPAEVVHALLEPLVDRAMRVGIAEVPLAEEARPVARA